MNKYKILIIDDKPISEHRYAMQQFLGRKLLTDEVIHHKNLIKNDNRIDNLVIMTKAEHTRLHDKLPKHWKSNDINTKPQGLYITVRDVMAKYDVEKDTVHSWKNKGMPSYKFCGLRRFIEVEVDKWVNEQ